MENSKLKILKFDTLPSTSQKLKELLQKGARPWTIVLAKEQTAGHGKGKRKWYSPRGGLYFSIVLPESNIEDLQVLTILAAFAVAKVIKEKFKLEPFIKLPNDVFVNGKKIAGILTENVVAVSAGPDLSGAKRIEKKVKSSVMGIGMNTNIDNFPEDLKDKATSLKIELKREVDSEDILKKVVEMLKVNFKTISQ